MRFLAALNTATGKSAAIVLSAIFGVVTFLALSVWHVIGGGHPFDGLSFSTAWGLTLGASAAAISGHAYVQAKASQINASNS